MNLPKYKVVYVAGPMTGLPQFNIPAFRRETARLRAAGYTVVSPEELDSDAIRQEALKSTDGALALGAKIGGETWGDILARDVRVIADTVDAICVLPDWHKSRGARLEVFVALLCKKPIYEDITYAEAGAGDSLGMPAHLRELSLTDVVFAIARSFLP